MEEWVDRGVRISCKFTATLPLRVFRAGRRNTFPAACLAEVAPHTGWRVLCTAPSKNSNHKSKERKYVPMPGGSPEHMEEMRAQRGSVNDPRDGRLLQRIRYAAAANNQTMPSIGIRRRKWQYEMLTTERCGRLLFRSGAGLARGLVRADR